MASQSDEWNPRSSGEAPLVGSADLNGLRLGFRELRFDEIGDKICWSHVDTYVPERSRMNVRLTAQGLGTSLDRRRIDRRAGVCYLTRREADTRNG